MKADRCLGAAVVGDPEPLVTANFIADVLGVRPDTVLDWFEDGRLPGFKVGRAVRFRWSEIEEWLTACRRGPDRPVQSNPTTQWPRDVGASGAVTPGGTS